MYGEKILRRKGVKSQAHAHHTYFIVAIFDEFGRRREYSVFVQHPHIRRRHCAFLCCSCSLSLPIAMSFILAICDIKRLIICFLCSLWITMGQIVFNKSKLRFLRNVNCLDRHSLLLGVRIGISAPHTAFGNGLDFHSWYTWLRM